MYEVDLSKIFSKQVMSELKNIRPSTEIPKEEFYEFKDALYKVLSYESSKPVCLFIIKHILTTILWYILLIINCYSCIKVWKSASALVFNGVPMLIVLISMTLYVMVVIYFIRIAIRDGVFLILSVNRLKTCKQKLELLSREEFSEDKPYITDYKYFAAVSTDHYINQKWFSIVINIMENDEIKRENRRLKKEKKK